MAKLGTLLLDIRTNTAKFQQGMDRVEKKMDRFGRNAKKMLRIAATVGGVTGLGLLVKRNLEAADAIGKAADTVGLGVEAYQELQQATERAGIEQSQFTSNMTAFVKRVGEARENTGPLVTFLKKYDEGLLRAITSTTSQEQALNIMADAIQNASTETERAALANAAFSRAGVQMTIALKDGSQGLREQRDRVRELGNVLREDYVRNAEAANDRVDELTKNIGLRFTAVVAENAEAIENMAESILSLVNAASKGISKIQEFGDIIGRQLGEAKRVTALDLLEKKIDTTLEKIKEANAVINDDGFLGFGGSTDKEIEDAKARLVGLNAQLEKYQVLFERLTASQNNAKQNNNGQGVPTPAPLPPPDPIVSEESRKLFDENAAEKLSQVNEFLLTEEERIKESYLNRQFIVENAYESEIISTERRNEVLKALEEKMRNEITSIQSRSLQQQIQLEKSAATQKANTVLGTIKGITAGVAQQSKVLFQINKAAALADAAINIPAAASGAYKWGAQIGGPPLGAAMASLAVGAQVAQMAAIASTQFGGGGSVPPSAAGSGAGSVVATTPLSQQIPQETQSSNRTLRVDLGSASDGRLLTAREARRLLREIEEARQDMGENTKVVYA